MHYAQLVARLSEVTRALVECGDQGEFDTNSLRFRLGAKVPPEIRENCFLRILTGNAEGTYRITSVGDDDVGVEKRWRFDATGVAWELYDAGVSEDDVRNVLLKFPDVIMECEEGEQVKTYLGVFRIVRRKRKRVKDPQGRWTFSKERLYARIRPGKKLQRDLEDEPSEADQPSVFSLFSSDDLDEDPED